MIKTHASLLLAGTLILGGALNAAPLVQTEIAKDAKWLAHIDMEGIMKSSFADLGVAKLKQEIANANESAISIDIDMLLSEIKSLTAYGSSFEDDAASKSVVILKTGDRMQAIFDGFIASQELEGQEIPLQRVEEKPYQTYLLENELYLAFPSKNYAITGKSFEQIERAYAVILGEDQNLSQADQKLVLNEDSGFFLMITANGINSFKDVPPQARMLQKTKGGQISIGESEGDFKANVVLTTANPEVSLQLRRIVDGMLALASFTQIENQSMMEVVSRVEVSHGPDFVALDFDYPVEKLMSLVEALADQSAEPDEATEGEGHSSNQEAPRRGVKASVALVASLSDA